MLPDRTLSSPPTPPRNPPTPKQKQSRQQIGSSFGDTTLSSPQPRQETVSKFGGTRLSRTQQVPQTSSAQRPALEHPTSTPIKGWKSKPAPSKQATAAPLSGFETRAVPTRLLTRTKTNLWTTELVPIEQATAAPKRIGGLDFSTELTRGELSSSQLCKACNKVFPSIKAFKRHRRIVHGFRGEFFFSQNTARSTAGNTPPRAPYSSRSLEPQRRVSEPTPQLDSIRTQCRVCGDIFHSKNSFKRHRRRGKRGHHQCEFAESREPRNGTGKRS